MPLLAPPEKDESGRETDRIEDFFFIDRAEPDEAVEAIKALVRERIPSKFRLDPINDVQVITPMHNGTLGTRNLNAVLQDLLNPRRQSKGEPEEERGPFRVRDKVMQVRNNYDKDVFNGDVGVVAAINTGSRTMSVKFDSGMVGYDFSETEQLQPAYASTVHKSQGSEYPAVVIPIHTQHYIMLQRNLLYTAVTRGKSLVCLVGTKKALAMAVKNDQIQSRNSALDQWLKNEMDSESKKIQQTGKE
jgi:exodeoxyribonuclease V alpha subunit